MHSGYRRVSNPLRSVKNTYTPSTLRIRAEILRLIFICFDCKIHLVQTASSAAQKPGGATEPGVHNFPTQ
jgi:hypothetical protein